MILIQKEIKHLQNLKRINAKINDLTMSERILKCIFSKDDIAPPPRPFYPDKP